MATSRIPIFLRRMLRIARTEIAAVTALFVVALGVMTFVEVADDMTEADGQAFDQAVLTWMQPVAGEPRGPWWLQEAAADLTSLGGISVLGLFAVIAITFLLIQRKRLSALLLVLGLAGGVALSEGLKALFERERPPAAFQAVETLNASFPSGHALLSTVFYLTLGVMLTRAFPRAHLKAFVLGAAMTVALLIGLTRVYLGAHWASDVFAGWCAGAAWAMALWLAAYAIGRRQAVRASGLHDDVLPPEPGTDTPPAVIGE
ncbi:phosphatase PAP2 family protein [Brevundimonas sp. UBA2416]|uniref:phosphatase PAP2 family protein n=1 Tax=Brevundimonas sp. UBA2416 TaxID=1946124 RepID=UPI0025C5D81B|nr:phosphatase PAP2 family protein [Brevundimonas sp. UBA2416]HRJ62899.1 phosphatase PAP2 family protein [Brevundimonas sp.]